MPPSSQRSMNWRHAPYPILSSPPDGLDEDERASWYEFRQISQSSGDSWPDDARDSIPRLLGSVKKSGYVRNRGISAHCAYRQIMGGRGTWAHVVLLRVLFKDAFKKCDTLHRVLAGIYPGAPADFQVDEWGDEYNASPCGLPMNNDAFRARREAEDEDGDYHSEEDDDDDDGVASLEDEDEDEDEPEKPIATAPREQSLPLPHRPVNNALPLPQASSGSADKRDAQGLATPTRQQGRVFDADGSSSDDEKPLSKLRRQHLFRTPQRPQGIALLDGLAEQGVPASAPGRLTSLANPRNSSPQTPTRAPTLNANAAAARNRAAAYFRDAGDRESKAGENYRKAAENELRAAELWELVQLEGA